MSSMPSCAASFHTLFPHLAVANNKLFSSPLLLVSLQPTPIFSALHLVRSQMQQSARHSFTRRQCVTTVLYLSPILLISLELTTIFYALYPGRHSMLPRAMQSFP